MANKNKNYNRPENKEVKEMEVPVETVTEVEEVTPVKKPFVEPRPLMKPELPSQETEEEKEKEELPVVNPKVETNYVPSSSITGILPGMSVKIKDTATSDYLGKGIPAWLRKQTLFVSAIWESKPVITVKVDRSPTEWAVYAKDVEIVK